jgi:hypothetical protein
MKICAFEDIKMLNLIIILTSMSQCCEKLQSKYLLEQLSNLLNFIKILSRSMGALFY